MAAEDHRMKVRASIPPSRTRGGGGALRRASGFDRGNEGRLAPTPPFKRDSVPCEDVREVIQLSTACVGCFQFDTPIPTVIYPDGITPEDLVDRLYETPSRCVEASLRLALQRDKTSSEELIGLTLGEVLPCALGYDKLFARWCAGGLSGQAFEVTVRASDSSPLVMQVVIYAHTVRASFSRIWVVLRDVTIHARAVQALARTELHYRSLLERPGLILIRVRPDGWYEYISPSVQAILGHSVHDFNALPNLLRSLTHPDDRSIIEGLLHPASYNSSVSYEGEVRLKLPNGVYHRFFSRHVPKVAPEGGVEYIDLLFVDLQERTQLSIENVAGVAHDLKNYLIVLGSQIERGLSLSEPSHPSYNALQEAQRSLSACSHLARKLLSVDQPEDLRRRSSSVAALLRAAVTLSQHLANDDIRIELTECDERLFIECSPEEIQRVLMNLILNARDALNGRGTIDLSARRVPAQTGASQHYVAISVRDDGSGIPEQDLQRVFEPYFTTKSRRGGSGLGLSNVRSCVEGQGGRIELRSTLGIGSEFLLIFPLLGETDTPTRPSAEVSVNKQPLSVLIVDDDDGVRETLVLYSTRLGHQTHGVANGELLLSLLTAGGSSYDLIIIDDSMPGIRGVDLIPKLQQLAPGVAIILTSGDPRIAGQMTTTGQLPLFLAKPFSLEELDRAIQQAHLNAHCPR